MRWRAATAVVIVAAATIIGVQSTEAASGDGCGHGLQKLAEDVEGTPLCSHGPDPQLDARGEPLFPPDDGSAPPPPCIGDGESGYRIEVIYGVPADVEADEAAALPQIRDAVASAAHYFEQSHEATTQHLRWVCDPATGEVVVRRVALAPIGDDDRYTFVDMWRSVSSAKNKDVKRPLRRKDRIYVTFVDGIADVYPYCGQGSLYDDDTPSERNRNNRGPAYSLIACWTGATTLHEIGHNLGAVQLTAPHSSGRHHCYDESDIMCYDDGGSYFAGPDGRHGTADDRGTELTCVDPQALLLGARDRQFDCNLDDYYNPAPEVGSYLAAHWNIANSNWVVDWQG